MQLLSFLNLEHHDDHLQGGDGEYQVQLRDSPPRKAYVEEGEYQVQHSPEHHGDHLHAEKVQDKVQHNIQNTMVITIHVCRRRR